MVLSNRMGARRDDSDGIGAEDEDLYTMHLERQQSQQSNSLDDMDAAHVDTSRLLKQLQAAISGNEGDEDDEDDEDEQDSKLPPLPNDDEDEDSFLRSDASFLDKTDAEVDVDHLRSDMGHTTYDEGELRRHLMDVESSFLPDSGPGPSAAREGRHGPDDTYVNMRSPAQDALVSQLLGISNNNSMARTPDATLRGNQSSRDANDDDDEHSDDQDFDEPSISDQSASGIQPSSPAAAAAERTSVRTSTRHGNTMFRYQGDDGDVSAHARSTYLSPGNDEYQESSQSESSQFLRPRDVGLPPSNKASLLSLNSLHSAPSPRPSKRPSYFSNRQISQRSYAESILSPAESTVNADYALQTGGAIPSDDNTFHSHHSGRSGQGLSRLPSFGSIASAVSRDSDDDHPVLKRGVSGASVLASLRADPLARLDEEDRSSTLSDPITPRPPTTSTFAEPTDTVIAQHVQDIQVPDTIARDFHQRNRSMSPEKRPHSSSNMYSLQGRTRSNNLTLKEQNSKIDKLTKENFDLKLKIHFLDQALQNRSDEGVKDMINKNVQYQTDLANERKENQTLRRRIKDMERKFKDQEEELVESRKTAQDDDSPSKEDLEYEIIHLSEEVDRCQVKITMLSADNMAKEIDKRKMAEYISALNDRKGNEESAAEEESEMWKDLLTTESTRREQAEDDIRKLREEIVMLRTEKSTEASSKGFGFNRLRRQKNFESRSASRDSEETKPHSEAATASSATLVEQLRHENAELRRDLGAQTSMLTSRNKERERLQQEIEDLKISHRKGDGARSVAGDSIFERSISRQHQRATSRTSGQTGTTPMSDTERDEWERREGILRDQNASLRMEFQELEREYLERDDYVENLERAVENLESSYDSAIQDLQALQKERDDALQAMEEREREALRLKSEYEKLKDEAVVAINELEGDLDEREEEVKRLVSDLKDRNDDFYALQRELRDLNNSLMQLEDDRAAALKRIELLELEIEEATQELEAQDKKLQESNQKNERLEVQQESLHGEISFLREEQEGDKIKIGDLENSLNTAQQSIQDERDKMQQLEDSLVEERRQHDIVNNQSKEEVQKVLNDLNDETTRSKDEVRRLRRALGTKELEATTFKKSLEELETNLRRTLGDFKNNRQSWVREIERLQNDLQDTLDDLERTKGDLAEKDRLLRNRDQLLESSALESRKVSDLLDKERDARKRDLHQFEQMSRGHSVNNRTIAQHESRVLELETGRSQDRRKMAMLEQQYRDQLIDRNNLLLALWNRLSTLCGNEWAQNHSLVNGEVPSVDIIARSLPAFNKNILEAVRTIEALLGGFKQRIRGVEKTLMKDYQTLATNLDGRAKRMDFLEKAVKDAQAQIEEQAREQTQLRAQDSSRGVGKSGEEMAKLKQEVKQLRAEVKFYRQNPASSASTQQQQGGAAAAGGSNRKSSAASLLSPKNLANTLMRHHSSTTVETLQQQQQKADAAAASASSSADGSNRQPIVIATPPIQPSEQRWIHRLKELERRLKAEREARLLDRRGARQRLEERSAENEELRMALEREKDRRPSVVSGTGFEEEEMAAELGGSAATTIRGRDRAREGSID